MIPSLASAGKRRKIANSPRQSDVFSQGRSEFNGHSEKRESAEKGRRQEAGCEKASCEKGDGEEVGGQEAGGEENDGEEDGGEEAGREEDHREEVGGQEAGGEEDDGEEAGGQEDGREEVDGEEAGRQKVGREKGDGEKAGCQKVCPKIDGAQDDRSTPYRHQGQRASRAGTQSDESEADHEAEGKERIISRGAARRRRVAYLPRSPCADGVFLLRGGGMTVTIR
jgi:hypothetical protein